MSSLVTDLTVVKGTEVSVLSLGPYGPTKKVMDHLQVLLLVRLNESFVAVGLQLRG
jgi:hypothetical protein